MNSREEIRSMIPYLRNKSIHQIAPANYMQIIEFAEHPPGSCIVKNCGRPMGQNEIKPPGKITDRAICPQCWHDLKINLPQICFVCGRHLHQDQKADQDRYPDDIHYRIHKHRYMAHENMPCKDYFVICTAHFLGIETGLIEANNWRHRQQAQVPINASHYALPLPEPQLRVSNIIRHGQPEPIPVRYNNKPVITLKPNEWSHK